MIYDPEKFLLLAGPCSLESLDTCRPVADALALLQQQYPELNLLFKGSFDKANRTSIASNRGTGLDTGMEIFQTIKAEYGFKTITDIHSPEQCASVGTVVDALQIPAFLCRQTDLLLAAAKTDCTINVKKGQFLSPWDMKNVVTKLNESKSEKILLTDRGTQFGYNNLIADMRSIPIMQELGYPVVFDATHSAQLPGGNGITSSGMREMIPILARSAVAAGCDGIFMEVHHDIKYAKSDAATQWPLSKLEDLLIKLKCVYEAVN